MLALGVSPFIMASTESLVGFVLNGSLEKFGDIYVGALAILQSAMQLVSVPLTGFAQGFVPVASYNYGHGDRQRVKDCFRIVLTVMFSFNFVLMLLMICFPSVVASAFTSDRELIATVEHVLPIFLAGMTIFGLQRACQNMFVALGQARISILSPCSVRSFCWYLLPWCCPVSSAWKACFWLRPFRMPQPPSAARCSFSGSSRRYSARPRFP